MNERKHRQPRIGVQGSVIGWDDPWHEALCSTSMRTGEGKIFPSQDPTPSRGEFVRLIKGMGVDFYLHHVMPGEAEIDSFIDDFDRYGLPYYLANEYGNINGPYTNESNRYDLPASSVHKAHASGKLLGLFYDEAEHLQLHPDMYLKNHPGEAANPRHQFAPTAGRSLAEMERGVSESARAIVQSYGGDIPLFSEHVFPVMYHALARGGFNLCPKVLKEEFQSLQLSTALGAARQYKRQLGICVDLWGQDVGPWFTRLWGFPGHSPREYRSALEMAYLMGPAMMFTENVDPLAVYGKGGFAKTEFGDIFEQFIRQFVPEHPLHYDHSMVDPDIVLIRSDDTDIAIPEANRVSGLGGRLYGSPELPGNEQSQSAFRAFRLLSRGTLPANGNTFFLPQYEYPAGRYPRNAQTLSALPLPQGVDPAEATRVHGLFYPLGNVAVYDEHVDAGTLGSPRLIVLAGSRMTDACLKAVGEKVRAGAVCAAAEWLLPEGGRKEGRDGLGQWIVTRDFAEDRLLEQLEPLLGERDCWKQRFGDYEVRFYNDNKDGVALTHTVTRLK